MKVNNRQNHRIRLQQAVRRSAQVEKQLEEQGLETAWLTDKRLMSDFLWLYNKCEVWFKLILMVLCFIIAGVLGVVFK